MMAARNGRVRDGGRQRGGGRWWERDLGGMPVWAIAVAAAVIPALLYAGMALRPSAAADTGSASPPVVVYLGDSYTAGTGATDKSLGWASIVGEAEGWRVRNLARGGTGYVARVEGEAAPAACGRDVCPDFTEMAGEGSSLVPDIVVVSGGRNDLGDQPLDEGVAHFFDVLRADYPQSTIYVTNVLWHEQAPEAADALSAIVQAHADRIGATWLDLGQPLAAGADLLAPDGIHPNDAGHEAIAEAVIDALG